MHFITDFHIHSHYSMATSKNLIPEYLDYFARLKGINVIGTGDCIHPGWFSELKEKLEKAENGLYRLKQEYILPEAKYLHNAALPGEIYFMLTGEVSSIYKKDDKVRKVHNLCVFPDFDTAKKVQDRLDKIGNIRSDGRPILGLDSKILLDMVLESGPRSFLIPAHIWTPWFSVLGSKSGFNTLDECYEDLTQHIFAVETGLSSDPPMNRVCSFLDKFRLVSNSDAHSPEKLGREANLFNTELSYNHIYDALKNDNGFLGTIEFFPQEGKYHYDGHRKCNVRWTPLETIKHKGICPVCGKAVTKGVMYRVAELADRAYDEKAHKQWFYSITQLADLLAEMLGKKSSKTKAVQNLYHRLIADLGSEFNILLFAAINDIKSCGGDVLGNGIKRLRAGDIYIEEGYDGDFGRIKVFNNNEIEEESLFTAPAKKTSQKGNAGKDSIKFDIEEFKSINNTGHETTIFDTIKERDTQPEKKPAKNEQDAAIAHETGPCMVIAGPGSGKTYTLTRRIITMIKEHHVDPAAILTITFSNKAAREISERLKDEVDTGSMTISTFHAFGLKILSESFEYTGRREDFLIVDDEDRMAIIKEVIDDKRKIKAVLKEIDAIKQGITIDAEYPMYYEMYNGKLKELNAFDLADLIHLPVEIFKAKPEVAEASRNTYQWILIDEFQDINAKQYELIKFLADKPEANLFVIGDPDQAIYGFRGSDVRFIKQFEQDYPKVATYHLSKSFRCPDPVMKIANQILQKDDSFKGKADTMKITIQEIGSAKSEADWIAGHIENIMGGVRTFSIDSGITDGHTDDEAGFNDFAVLCRSSFMFDNLVEAFHNHGIAYQVAGTDSLFFREPYRSTLRLIKLHYYNLTGIAGFNAGDLMIQQMLDDQKPLVDIALMILERNGGTKDDRETIIPYLKPYGNNYRDFFKQVALRKGVDDFDAKAEAVTIMTLHASKGLEFNYVFIPGCEQGIIPFELFGKKEQAELDEEERLFYVGVTRTKKNLFLTHTKKRIYKGRILQQKRSVYLDRLEKELLEVAKRDIKKKKDKDFGQLELF